MIKKEKAFCAEKNEAVEAIVRGGRGGSREAVSCTCMARCAKTTFCRFVNPLTTRNPLQVGSGDARAAS